MITTITRPNVPVGFDADVPNPDPIPGCSSCNGTGWIPGFESGCYCPLFTTTTLYERFDVPNDEPRHDGDPTGTAKSSTPRPTFAATERQVVFARKLVAERDPENPLVHGAARLLDEGKLSKRDASNLIDALLATPKATRPVDTTTETPAERSEAGLDLSTVPSGYYAIPGGDTRLKIKIDNVDKGKWTGWVFVKDAAVYGENKRYGSQRPGQTYRGDVEDALRTIVADPFEASKAYGRLVGRCGVCGRHLEDETSVTEGIGPVCRAKFG